MVQGYKDEEDATGVFGTYSWERSQLCKSTGIGQNIKVP